MSKQKAMKGGGVNFSPGNGRTPGATQRRTVRLLVVLFLAAIFYPCAATANNRSVKMSDEAKNETQPPFVEEKLVKMDLPLFPSSVSEKQYEEILTTQTAEVPGYIESDSPRYFPTNAIALVLPPISTLGSSPIQKLEVFAAPELNLARGGYGKIVIDSVLNAEGDNIGVGEDSLQEWMQNVFQQRVSSKANLTNSIRPISLKEGTGESEVHSVSGTLYLRLPVSVKTVTLTARDIGHPLDISPDLRLNLLKFENGKIEMELSGEHKEPERAEIYPLNAAGQWLDISGMKSTTYAEKVKNLLWVCGTPESAKVIFFEKFLEKEYPFIIRR